MIKKISIFLLLAAVAGVSIWNSVVNAQQIKDISEEHWAKPSIEYLMKNNIIKLEPDGSYNGDKFINRYEVAVILARILNESQNKKTDSISSKDLDTVKTFLKDLSDEILEVKKSLKEIREKIGLDQQKTIVCKPSE